MMPISLGNFRQLSRLVIMPYRVHHRQFAEEPMSSIKSLDRFDSLRQALNIPRNAIVSVTTNAKYACDPMKNGTVLRRSYRPSRGKKGVSLRRFKTSHPAQEFAAEDDLTRMTAGKSCAVQIRSAILRLHRMEEINWVDCEGHLCVK